MVATPAPSGVRNADAWLRLVAVAECLGRNPELVEYRRDDAEQLDPTQTVLTHTERTVWLFRNTFRVQLTPDWRLLGKLNHSFSDSSLGDFL